MIILTLAIGVFLIPLCLEAILPLNLNSVCFTFTLTFGYILSNINHVENDLIYYNQVIFGGIISLQTNNSILCYESANLFFEALDIILANTPSEAAIIPISIAIANTTTIHFGCDNREVLVIRLIIRAIQPIHRLIIINNQPINPNHSLIFCNLSNCLYLICYHFLNTITVKNSDTTPRSSSYQGSGLLPFLNPHKILSLMLVVSLSF